MHEVCNICLVLYCAVSKHRRLWLAANLHPYEYHIAMTYKAKEEEVHSAFPSRAKEQRSLMVMTLKETNHIVKVAVSLRGHGSSVAFWSEVSRPSCFASAEYTVCALVDNCARLCSAESCCACTAQHCCACSNTMLLLRGMLHPHRQGSHSHSRLYIDADSFREVCGLFGAC